MFMTSRHKIVLASVSYFLLIILLLGPVFAGQETAASSSDVATLYSVKLPGDHIQYSSPIMADINGDGLKEIIAGGKDGKLHVVNADGTIRWTASTGKPIQSSPAAGDLDGDGDMEVVVTAGGEVGYTSGGVYAYNHDGTPLWTFPTPAGIFSTPALGDLDGDGKMEVAFGCWDHYIYLLNSNGTQRWRHHNADTIWSSPALADLDGDGDLEIITGADYHPGGYIYVFDKDGAVLVKKFIGQTIMSSPAIGDINDDGNLDIVVGTGRYDFSSEPGNYVNAWDRNGNYLPNWPRPTGGRVANSPALADLDGDGSLEVVTACEDHKLYAWNGDGSPVPNWPVTPKTMLGATQLFNMESPTVADYDGDGQLEVFMPIGWEVAVIGANGVQETNDGAHPGNPTYNSGYIIPSSPAIGDIDNDGALEMAVGGSHHTDPSYGYLHVWRVGPTAGAGLPWPMFHHDARHTGLAVGPPYLRARPRAMPILHPQGRASSSSVIIVENTGGGMIEWTGNVNPLAPAPIVTTLDPISGTVGESARVAVTVMVSGLTSIPIGSYNLAQVTIDGTAGGAPVDGSPQTVDLTLKVGNLTWLPPILK